MNSSSEVLMAVKAQRAARERLEAVRTPWYRWQAPSLQTAILVMLLCAFFAPTSLVHATRWRATWVTGIWILLWLNQRLRERAWRRLVEAEAPDLHRKLNGTDA